MRAQLSRVNRIRREGQHTTRHQTKVPPSLLDRYQFRGASQGSQLADRGTHAAHRHADDGLADGVRGAEQDQPDNQADGTCERDISPSKDVLHVSAEGRESGEGQGVRGR